MPPKTLLEMAGINPVPPPLEACGLVLIDMQQEYLDGRLPLPGAEATVAEAARLLQRFRLAGRPVVHIRHRGRAGGLFDPEGPGFAIAPALRPREDETVLDKTLPNSFAGTGLDQRLRALELRQIVFAGFMTHMCVSSSVRAALDLGFQAAVLGDACATRDLPDGAGGVVPARDLHRAELAALADRFAVVVPNVEAFGGSLTA